MIEDLMGAYGSRLGIAVAGVGIAFVCLIGVLWFMRGRNGPSPFVRGGRNRNPRLQVLDAAAVDTRRRLVLVRRDDVEHLIMIGGPTDIVIESRITPATTFANEISGNVPDARPAVENRPTPALAPAPRPLPAAAPEPRPEPPAREFSRDALRELPPVRESARAVTPTTAPTAQAAPPRPEAAPRAAAATAPAPRPEMAVRTAPPETRAEPVRQPLSPTPPIAAVLPKPAAPAAPAVENAVSALDAARNRVFQDTPEPAKTETPRVVAISAATVPPALQAAAEKPKVLGSDFERILEQEMAQNLAAREETAIAQPEKRQLPPRDPAVPKLTGATPEPSLQSEMAKIFGEMSVTRDK